MSYVITIRRQDGRPILFDACAAVLANDPEFHTEALTEDMETESVRIFAWRPDSAAKPVSFTLNEGVIDVTTPSNAALRKMQSLARRLDAVVIGEEGEDLSDVSVSEDEPAGYGMVAWIGLLVLLAIMAYWLFF